VQQTWRERPSEDAPYLGRGEDFPMAVAEDGSLSVGRGDARVVLSAAHLDAVVGLLERTEVSHALLRLERLALRRSRLRWRPVGDACWCWWCGCRCGAAGAVGAGGGGADGVVVAVSRRGWSDCRGVWGRRCVLGVVVDRALDTHLGHESKTVHRPVAGAFDGIGASGVPGVWGCGSQPGGAGFGGSAAG